jgi:hypothetical protein
MTVLQVIELLLELAAVTYLTYTAWQARQGNYSASYRMRKFSRGLR